MLGICLEQTVKAANFFSSSSFFFFIWEQSLYMFTLSIVELDSLGQISKEDQYPNTIYTDCVFMFLASSFLCQWSFGVTLWELVTLGQTPYLDLDPFEMAAFLKSGYRMPQPPSCPDELWVVLILVKHKLLRDCIPGYPRHRCHSNRSFYSLVLFRGCSLPSKGAKRIIFGGSFCSTPDF